MPPYRAFCSIPVLLKRDSYRKTDLKQRGKFSGNKKPNVVRLVGYRNIVVELDSDYALSGDTIVGAEQNMFAHTSQIDFDHFAPYSSSGAIRSMRTLQLKERPG